MVILFSALQWLFSNLDSLTGSLLFRLHRPPLTLASSCPLTIARRCLRGEQLTLEAGTAASPGNITFGHLTRIKYNKTSWEINEIGNNCNIFSISSVLCYLVLALNCFVIPWSSLVKGDTGLPDNFLIQRDARLFCRIIFLNLII